MSASTGLADRLPPDTKDGEVLHRAAQEFLPEFLDMVGDGVYQNGILRAMRHFDEAMCWLQQPPPSEPEARRGLPLEPPGSRR